MRVRPAIAAACFLGVALAARSEEPADASMQHHMHAMQQSMDQIHRTADPAQRRELMRERMVRMRAAMKDIREMGECGECTMHAAAASADVKDPSSSVDAERDALRRKQHAMEWMLDVMDEQQNLWLEN